MSSLKSSHVFYFTTMWTFLDDRTVYSEGLMALLLFKWVKKYVINSFLFPFSSNFELTFWSYKMHLHLIGMRGFLPRHARPSSPTHLIVRAQFLAVGSERQQPAGSVHHAADLQAIIVTSLPGTHALACTHHVAVAAFDAEFQNNIFIFVRPQVW